MNMKKLFTMLIVSAFCTMAYAATAKTISVKSVTIPKGGTAQLEVTVNNATNNTAFQFDLTLPKGVSVQSVTMNNGAIVGKKVTEAEDTNARKLKYGVRDANANKYRFLSYDNNNAKLTDGKVVITLAASADAEAGTKEITGSEFVVVDPETATNSAGDEETSTADITINDVVNITIGNGTAKATTFVCDADLDFTDNKDLTAYIITGMELENDKTGFWIAPINQVPANTPIYVKAKAEGETAPGTYPVVKKELKAKTYYKSFLVGNNTDDKITVTPEDGYQYFRLATSGWTKMTSATDISAHKAYIRAPKYPTANAGNDWPLEIKGDRTSLCASVDLDFSDQTDLKAYTVMGYDGAYWIAPVTKVSAGTPLYLKGPKAKYTITSAATQAVYANMLVGNNTDAAITIQPTDGEYTNLFLSNSGFSTFTEPRETGAHKAYLQVLTSYRTAAASRGIGQNNVVYDEKVAEVFKVIVDGEDDGVTAISRVAAETVGNDAWYNLSGQRISAPTKKGLYIKNGKKIVVK